MLELAERRLKHLGLLLLMELLLLNNLLLLLLLVPPDLGLQLQEERHQLGFDIVICVQVQLKTLRIYVVSHRADSLGLQICRRRSRSRRKLCDGFDVLVNPCSCLLSSLDYVS